MQINGKKRGRPHLLVPIASFAAGVLNGLLGTGGGMVLTLALRAADPEHERDGMALSTACMLFFSVMTTILYEIQGHLSLADTLPVLLPAFLGGALGSLLLGRLRLPAVDMLLALLLLYSGLSLLLR